MSQLCVCENECIQEAHEIVFHVWRVHVGVNAPSAGSLVETVYRQGDPLRVLAVSFLQCYPKQMKAGASGAL